ncbi:hypothetical protein ppKF707_3794 [Metapseudomonas furukawaii]|uniref:Uncharacterized protein n=1 Tax=Metapseudomonas furukawaii TaxID=1149133 RepID=A0AAD1BXC0_METFU|nr:hypothetical protein ppKF707_3794 [Pseudomonas furukawaii]BAU73579.1 hypothetical protein KF707C_18910 [Pseudomonas furukawaii]
MGFRAAGNGDWRTRLSRSVSGACRVGEPTLCPANTDQWGRNRDYISCLLCRDRSTWSGGGINGRQRTK